LKVLAGVLAALAVAIPSASIADPPIQMFILAGQSNMVGRALPVSEGTGVTSNLMLFRDGVWQAAADPLGPADSLSSGVGPGMTFGVGALGHEPPGTTVGLIMCAQGSTSIADWKPGKSTYNACKSAVRAAGGVVAGIVFLQGESEAQIENGGSRWKSGFNKVEAGFENDFGPVPFVLGQIGTLDHHFAYQQDVRDEQAAADVRFAQVTLVTTTDLAVGSDGVHFTVDSEKTIGTRFADVWFALQQLFPTVSDASPDSGFPGTSVTITGTQFVDVSSVSFGRVGATYTVDSPTQITAIVPDGGITGLVRVTTPYGTVAGPLFAVLPEIDSFSPASGQVGTKVVVTGKALAGATSVTVNGVSAVKFKNTSAKQIKVTVPDGATSGPIAVTTAGGTAVSAGTFTVLPG
jgi:hypothetical protein